jgi:hypothetical protein
MSDKKYLVIRYDAEKGSIKETIVGRSDDTDFAFRLQELLGEMFPASDFAVTVKSEYKEIA